MEQNTIMPKEQTSAFIERMQHCYQWFRPSRWDAFDLADNFSIRYSQEPELVASLVNTMPIWMARDMAKSCIVRMKDKTRQCDYWKIITMYLARI